MSFKAAYKIAAQIEYVHYCERQMSKAFTSYCLCDVILKQLRSAQGTQI